MKTLDVKTLNNVDFNVVKLVKYVFIMHQYLKYWYTSIFRVNP